MSELLSLNGANFIARAAPDTRGTRCAIHREHLRLLYPILEQSDRFETSYDGATIVNGQTADRIRVKAKEQADVEIYLDRETSLLVKLKEDLVFHPEFGKTSSLYLSDYKEFHGVKCPQKYEMWVDNKLAMEYTLVELRPVKEFPRETFAKPVSSGR